MGLVKAGRQKVVRDGPREQPDQMRPCHAAQQLNDGGFLGFNCQPLLHAELGRRGKGAQGSPCFRGTAHSAESFRPLKPRLSHRAEPRF